MTKLFICAALWAISASASHIYCLQYYLILQCPASTAYHALELGFRTILIEDCSRGIRDTAVIESFQALC